MLDQQIMNEKTKPPNQAAAFPKNFDDLSPLDQFIWRCAVKALKAEIQSGLAPANTINDELADRVIQFVNLLRKQLARRA